MRRIWAMVQSKYRQCITMIYMIMNNMTSYMCSVLKSYAVSDTVSESSLAGESADQMTNGFACRHARLRVVIHGSDCSLWLQIIYMLSGAGFPVPRHRTALVLDVPQVVLAVQPAGRGRPSVSATEVPRAPGYVRPTRQPGQPGGERGWSSRGEGRVAELLRTVCCWPCCWRWRRRWRR